MKKIAFLLAKIFLYICGSFLLFIGIGGIISCVEAENVIELYFSLALTLILFLVGFVLFYVATKKINYKNNKEENIDIIREENSNKNNNQYVESNNILQRVDGKEITDKEIPYLIQAGYDEAIKRENESANPKFHRTETEEELSFNFEMKYGDKIGSFEDEFITLYQKASQSNNLTEKINMLKQASTAFEKAKKFCYSKGKGGTIYFQDMWEYCHNSSNTCFSYLDQIQRSLNDAIMERDTIIPGILHIIEENDGMLQKNIYKELPDINKADIQRVIRNLEAKNKINRIKKSNSYELHIVK